MDRLHVRKHHTHQEGEMFEIELGLREGIIVATIALIAFGHRRILDIGKRIKRFVTD